MRSEPYTGMLAPGITGMDWATNTNGNSMGYQRRKKNATYVAITTISLIPKVTEQTPIQSHHRRGKTRIASLSPYKEELQRRQNARISKDEQQSSGSRVS